VILDPSERRHATLQFVGCLTVGSLLAIAGVRMANAPADGPTLRIPIGELRSQAAEIAELQRSFESGSVSSHFLRSHSRQLTKATTASYRALSELKVQPPLADAKRRALDEARGVVSAVAALRAGQDVPAGDAELRRDALHRLEREVNR
jgi:hypothetical protein